MSLVFLHRECDTWKPGEHTGTFRGNNLAFVAARQLLEYWRDDKFGLEIEANGVRIELELKSIRDQFGSVCADVRGRGMIWGLEFAEPEMAGRVCRQAFQNGLMIETSGARDQVVKLLPPLTISREDLRCGLAILADSIQQSVGQEPVTSKFYAPDISSLEPGIHIGSFASI
jgi:diaminobutyrate-2-oxoglutarate transaminase